MAAKRRGLGRGLEALIGAPEGALEYVESTADSPLRSIPIEQIRRGRYQPRVHFDPDSLNELAESIRSQGVLQPIVVRPQEDGFELVAGERRWRAAQIAGLPEIPAVVRELDDNATAAIALIENIQRENLNPLEQANALKRLIDEFGMTHQEVSEAVGRSRASVSNLLRLRELTDEVKSLVDKGDIDMGHARALLGLDKSAQTEVARQVARQGLSVRQTEALVRKKLSPEKAAPAPRRDPDIARLEQDLADRLGARVEIQLGQGGRGKLVVHYKSNDELEGIIGKLG